MGILKDPKVQDTPAAKRKSLQADFANLGPLKNEGTVGFLNFRDHEARAKGHKGDGDEMESDDEDSDNPILGKADDEEAKDDGRFLSPDDIRRQGELADGVERIRVSGNPAEVLRMKGERKAKRANFICSSSVSTPPSPWLVPALRCRNLRRRHPGVRLRPARACLPRRQNRPRPSPSSPPPHLPGMRLPILSLAAP